MENKLLSFKAHVDKKDLEAFSQALMEQTIALQVENQKLKEKLEHLEELLKNAPVPELTSILPIKYATLKSTVYHSYGYYFNHRYEIVNQNEAEKTTLLTRKDHQTPCWVFDGDLEFEN